MQKVKLTKIYRSDKDKDGKPFKTQDGRPYSKIAIKCVEYGEHYINGFSSYWNKDWIEGQIVGIDVEEVEVNGKQYLNLKKPDPVAELEARVKELENQFAQFINQPQADEKKSPNDRELPF